jgi:hypothetical protein
MPSISANHLERAPYAIVVPSYLKRPEQSALPFSQLIAHIRHLPFAASRRPCLAIVQGDCNSSEDGHALPGRLNGFLPESNVDGWSHRTVTSSW